MKTNLVFVVGAAHVGKDTFANALAAVLGWKAMNTGDVLIDLLAQVYAAEQRAGMNAAEWRKMILADKERYRPCLVKLGNELRRAYPSELVHRCTGTGAQIIVGARKAGEIEEYGDCEDALCVYVERPGWSSPADGYALPLELLAGMFGERLIGVENSGDVEHLKNMAKEVAARM